MTPNTPVARPKFGSLTMMLKFSSGLHNLLTSIPLNTCGITSKYNLEPMKNHPRVLESFGLELKRNGMIFLWRNARN